MPFLQQAPRKFNRIEIESLDPNQNGVYGIFNEREWIYVGKGDLRQRLLDHLNGDNPSILQRQPTHWVGEVFAQNPSERERILIIECSPICNKKIG
jgi:hypothetical protein